MTQQRPAMQNPLIVGVDTHREMNVARLIDREGASVGKPLRVRNNRPGTADLAAQMAQVCAAGGYDGIQVACEATNWYWLGWCSELTQAPWPAPLEVYPLNPRLTAAYKKTLGEEAHTDSGDALVIAERLRMGKKLPEPFEPEDVYGPLRLLTRYRAHVAEGVAREKVYGLNLVYLKLSEYTLPEQRAFAETFGVTSQAVLSEFASCAEILAMPLEALAAWLDERGRHRFADPTDTAQRLRAVARDSFVRPPAWLEAVNSCLELALAQIQVETRQVAALDHLIAPHLEAIPNTLATIPGIGAVYAAGILAEIGDLQRFDFDDDKVAKYAGLTWRRHQSGDFEAEDTPITFHCNHYLRYYLCEAANLVRQREPAYAAYYDRKFAEATKHQHKRALVLTARKLVRLVVRLLTTHQPYRPGGTAA